MRLFLLVALTMTAFAANSLLSRAALASGGIDPASFGTLRLLSGAVVLAALVLIRTGGLRLGGRGRLAGVAGLFLYIYGFSAAYAGLPAGLGALLQGVARVEPLELPRDILGSLEQSKG